MEDNNHETKTEVSERSEDKFKKQIALQIIAASPDLTVDQALELIGEANKKGFDYVVQVARLNKFQKLKEGPPKIAEAWGKQVFPFLSIPLIFSSQQTNGLTFSKLMDR
jgi:hypothetical protein